MKASIDASKEYEETPYPVLPSLMQYFFSDKNIISWNVFP